MEETLINITFIATYIKLQKRIIDTIIPIMIATILVA